MTMEHRPGLALSAQPEARPTSFTTLLKMLHLQIVLFNLFYENKIAKRKISFFTSLSVKVTQNCPGKPTGLDRNGPDWAGLGWTGPDWTKLD